MIVFRCLAVKMEIVTNLFNVHVILDGKVLYVMKLLVKTAKTVFAQLQMSVYVLMVGMAQIAQNVSQWLVVCMEFVWIFQILVSVILGGQVLFVKHQNATLLVNMEHVPLEKMVMKTNAFVKLDGNQKRAMNVYLIGIVQTREKMLAIYQMNASVIMVPLILAQMMKEIGTVVTNY